MMYRDLLHIAWITLDHCVTSYIVSRLTVYVLCHDVIDPMLFPFVD